MPTMKNREEAKKSVVDTIKDFLTRKQPPPSTNNKSMGIKG